jgi:hypothetical protein
MKRRWVCARPSAIAILIALLVAPPAAAADPLVRLDFRILRNYRFIPSRSTLHVTGGFAGVDWELAVAGKFGVVTGFESGITCAAIGCPLPPYFPFAQFVDVDATAINPKAMGPMPWPGWDLDDTLNLSGLTGTFRPADPNHLLFHGEDGQGVPIKIEAVIRGPLIHLSGVNDPDCPGCADFFGYKFDAFGYLSPHADVNLDGTVDAADYVMWRKSAGQLASGGGANDGSATDPGDYDAWSTYFGDVVDFSAFDEASFSATAVPEPATVAMLLLGLALSLSIRRR